MREKPLDVGGRGADEREREETGRRESTRTQRKKFIIIEEDEN